MKLYYRGLSYEYDPSKETKQPFQPVRQSGSAYNLIYRGVTYHVDPNAKSAEVPLPLVAYQLIYRGIAYFVNRTAQGEVTVASQPASTSKFGTLSVFNELKPQG
jgi:Domain of unknown function (DUF4278)